MNLWKYLIAVVTVFILSNVNAALELELTQGIDSALPIAILPFAGQVSTMPNNKIASVIAKDLQNSGKFRVLDTRNHSERALDPNQVDYQYWRKKNVDNVVIGRVAQRDDHSFEVTFYLLDVLGQQHLLVSKTYNQISIRDLRALAHHISDIIYQQLTGDAGVFSTRVAYIVVERKPGQATKYLLEVADADGHNPRSLFTSYEPIMSPAWSANGKYLAYVSFENRRAQIFVANVATGKRKLITSYPGINGAPAWAPNGRKLALVLSKSGHPKIYTINLVNGKLTQLTQGWSIDTEPNWSPDGKSIIFTSDRGGAPQIYRYDLALKKINRMTFDGNYNARASYSPDGKEIVVLHRNGGMFNIAIQDLDSGQVEVLTKSGGDESPSLAPNGKMILYATRYGGNGVLSVVSTDGKIRLRLPAREGDVQEPAWSPFTT